jgi:hypothetical protein
MSDKAYLDQIIDDRYLEVGKSGKRFNKNDVIKDLSALSEDRNITIYNYTCDEITKGLYLIHYITKSGEDNIFRSSIWESEHGKSKIIFHQASLLKDEIELVKY